MSILPKAIFRFKSILSKSQQTFYFLGGGPKQKVYLQIVIELQGAKTTLKKKNKVRDSKSCYKATIIKTMWYWHKDRHTDQQNRNQHPEIHPNIQGQLFLTRMPILFNGERTVSPTHGVETAPTPEPVCLTTLQVSNSHIQKTYCLRHFLQNNQLKTDQRPKYRR